MKKKILLGLVIIFGLFIITGCENNKKESNSNEKKSNDNDIVCTKSNDYGSWKEERSLTYKFDDDNMTITMTRIETIKELDDDTKTKRYKQLNEDGTYNYEEWKNTTGKKNNWQCDK